MNNVPPLSTLFGYTKAIVRPSTEHLTLFYNYWQKKENPTAAATADRIDTSYETNNFWSLFYYYFTYPIEIVPNLYLGNIVNAANYELLEELEIDTIFNVTAEYCCYFPDDFTYHQIAITDSKNAVLPKEFYDAVDELNHALNNDHKVLVHCHHGRSRSVALIVSYLIKHQSVSYPTFEDAYQMIKSKKPIININTDFITQL